MKPIDEEKDKRRREELARVGTFLTNSTVTVYLDGLIMLAHNAEGRLCQAGIHTQAERHELRIEIFDASNPDVLLFPDPANGKPFDGSHANLNATAPLWLYVDSGNGHPPEEFSATLNRPDEPKFSQSFGHVLDFEGANLYNRRLVFNPATFALLNLPHGDFYSAQNTPSVLKKFGQHESFETAVSIGEAGDIIMSTLAAADIDASSDRADSQNGDPPPVVRSIVLEQENPRKELFREPLVAGRRLIINLMNVPIREAAHAGHTAEGEDGEHDAHGAHGAHGANGENDAPAEMSHAEHFLQFYEMFALLPEEQKFLVDRRPTGNDFPDAPPCNVGRAGNSDSFS